MDNVQALEIEIPREIVHSWGWFLAFGIGLVALGVAAVGPGYHSSRRLDAVLRMAAADGFRYRSRPSRHGRTLGRLLSPPAGGDPLWGNGRLAGNQAACQRRSERPSSWPCSSSSGGSFRSSAYVCSHPAGLGMAGAGRRYHPSARSPRSRAMARLGALGDRSLFRDRPDFLRLRVDRAGARLTRGLRRPHARTRLRVRNVRLVWLTCCNSWDDRMGHFRYWHLRRRDRR